jgi:hypothetical protein
MEITSAATDLDDSRPTCVLSRNERDVIIHDLITSDNPLELGPLDLPYNSLDARILSELKIHSRLLQQLVEHVTSL